MKHTDDKGRHFVTVDTGESTDVWPGHLVTWLHVPRGGYGYVLPTPAVVRDVARRPRTWVIIEITPPWGGPKVQRRVDVTNLRGGHP